MLTEAEAGRLSIEDRVFLKVGLELGIKSIVTGWHHADLHAAAKKYAEAQAAKGRQDGHAGWGKRSAELAKLMPSHPMLFEVTAESWTLVRGFRGHSQTKGPVGYYEESDDVPVAIAKSLLDSWRSSPGHWKIVNGTATYFGYAVAQGRRCWFGVGIVAK